MALKRAVEKKFMRTADGDLIQFLLDFTQALSKQQAAVGEGLALRLQRSPIWPNIPDYIKNHNTGRTGVKLQGPTASQGVCFEEGGA